MEKINIKKQIFKLGSILLWGLIIIFGNNCERNITRVKEDITAPNIISKININKINYDSVEIWWRTNEPCSSEILYSSNSQADTNRKADKEYRQNHSLLLLDLQPQTNYYFTIVNNDIQGNTHTIDSNFTTLENYSVYMKEGWEKFREDEFEKAFNSFQSYLEYESDDFEAQLGSGWSAMGAHMIDSARGYMLICNQQKPSYKDVLAGSNIVCYKDSLFYQAINYGEKLITGNDGLLTSFKKHYTFEYDSTLEGNDIALIVADSYIQINEYSEAQNILDRLESENDLIQTDSTYSKHLVNYVDSLKSEWWKELKYLP